MPGNTIKTTLALDGEQQYRRALNEVRASLRNVGTQLTLATAEFKRDGDAMKLTQTRSKALKEQMALQSTAIKSLQDTVRHCTETYGEKAKQTEKWQAELNRAKAVLAGLETELALNDAGLDKNGKAFQSAAGSAGQFGRDVKSAEKVANGVNFMALDSALSTLSRGFETVFRTIWGVARTGWNMVIGSGEWADDLATRAQQLGMTTTELQRWDYAALKVETDVNAITSGLTRLTNPSNEVKAALQDLGVAYNGMMAQGKLGEIDLGIDRPTVDIFWDAVDALGKLESAQRQEEIAKAIFGKSFREMIPLIQAGREQWEAYGDQLEANGGVLKDEQINALTSFNQAVKDLDTSLSATKEILSAQLAPAFQRISESFTGLVNNFNTWAQTPEGRDALEKLAGAVEALFTALTKDIDPEQVVSGITKAIQDMTGAFQWIADNSGKVVKGLEAMATALALLKVSQTVLSFLQLARGVNWKGVRDTLGGGQAGNGTTITSAVGNAAQNWANQGAALVGGTFLGKLGAGIGNLFTTPKGLLSIGALVAPPMIDFFKNPEKYLGTSEERENTQKILAMGAKLRQTNYKKALDFLAHGSYEGNGNDLLDQVINSIEETAVPVPPRGGRVKKVIGAAAEDAMAGAATEAAENVAEQAADKLNTAISENGGGKVAGFMLAEGLAQGITEKMDAVTAAARRLGGAAKTALSQVLEIHSPSRVMMEMGMFTGVGFARGIDDSIVSVRQAVGRMARATAFHPALSYGGAGATINGQTYNSNRSIYIDKYNQYSAQDVEGLMEAMDDVNTYNQRGRGA